MGGLNGQLFDWINKWPEAWNPFLKFFSVALSQGWVKIGFAFMIVAMLWRNERTRKAVLLALVAIGIANTMTNVAKEAYQGNRPFQDLGYVSEPTEFTLQNQDKVFLRVGHSDSRGTASAHSANMAALAFTMCFYLRWWGLPWALVALLTGISRIYTGAHYPYQVGLGWLCGIFAALVVIKTWEAFVRLRGGVQWEADDVPELP